MSEQVGGRVDVCKSQPARKYTFILHSNSTQESYSVWILCSIQLQSQFYCSAKIWFILPFTALAMELLR